MITMYILAGYCAGVALAVGFVLIQIIFDWRYIGTLLISRFKKPRTLIREGGFFTTDGTKVMTSIDCEKWGSDNNESREQKPDVEQEWVSVMWVAPTYQDNGYIWDDWFKKGKG